LLDHEIIESIIDIQYIIVLYLGRDDEGHHEKGTVTDERGE